VERRQGRRVCAKLDAIKEGTRLPRQHRHHVRRGHDGSNHSCGQLPITLIGGGGGKLKLDQHIVFTKRWLRDLHIHGDEGRLWHVRDRASTTSALPAPTTRPRRSKRSSSKDHFCCLAHSAMNLVARCWSFVGRQVFLAASRSPIDDRRGR